MKTTKIDKIPVTKLDAALRQLETAVILWFNSGDQISIHTLTAAAYQIIYDLNKHHKGPDMMPDSKRVKPQYIKMWKQILKKPSNFMKHADKDPNDTISFAPEATEYLLLEAIEYYSMFTQENRPILQCFLFWSALHNPDVFFEEFIIKLANSIPIDKLMHLSKIDFFINALPLFTRQLVSSHISPNENK
jgi:hypothetical protein